MCIIVRFARFVECLKNSFNIVSSSYVWATHKKSFEIRNRFYANFLFSVRSECVEAINETRITRRNCWDNKSNLIGIFFILIHPCLLMNLFSETVWLTGIWLLTLILILTCLFRELATLVPPTCPPCPFGLFSFAFFPFESLPRPRRGFSLGSCYGYSTDLE